MYYSLRKWNSQLLNSENVYFAGNTLLNQATYHTYRWIEAPQLLQTPVRTVVLLIWKLLLIL